MRSINRFIVAALMLVATFTLAAAGRDDDVPRDVAPAPTEIDAELIAHALEPGVWRIEHRRPWSANSLLVEMADRSLVLCDTPNDEVATKTLLDWIHERFGRDRRLVAIVSHHHTDAAGGVATLLAADVPVHGSARTARLLRERGARMAEQLAADASFDADVRARFAKARFAPPDHEFDDETTLRFGDERVCAFFPGEAHAPDNVVVWFPGRRVLFGGCMVKTGDSLGNVDDANLDAWPAAIDRLDALSPRTVVPGHGAPGGPELLENTKRLLECRSSSER